jgi:hypothetical protein
LLGEENAAQEYTWQALRYEATRTRNGRVHAGSVDQIETRWTVLTLLRTDPSPHTPMPRRRRARKRPRLRRDSNCQRQVRPDCNERLPYVELFVTGTPQSRRNTAGLLQHRRRILHTSEPWPLGRVRQDGAACPRTRSTSTGQSWVGSRASRRRARTGRPHRSHPSEARQSG